MVDQHKIICPKAKRTRLAAEAKYYRANCNDGGYGELTCRPVQSDGKAKSSTLEWAMKVARLVLVAHSELFVGEACKPDEVNQLSLKAIEAAIPLVDLSQPELDAGMEDEIKSFRIKSGGPRHIHQQASLVGHLRRIAALDDLPASSAMREKDASNGKTIVECERERKNKTILEVGAGRGMLGLVVGGVSAASTDPTRLIMIERSGSRGKAETVLRNLPPRLSTKDDREERDGSKHYLDFYSLQWSRVQCDLSHVDMQALLLGEHTDAGCDDKAAVLSGTEDASIKEEASSESQIIVIAKHLCGVGTDMALKALAPIRKQVSACIMATCCHGVCSKYARKTS